MQRVMCGPLTATARPPWTAAHCRGIPGEQFFALADCIWHESLFRMRPPKRIKKKVARQNHPCPGQLRHTWLQKAEALRDLNKHLL